MSKFKKYLVSAFVIRLILVFLAGYHPDIRNHVDWGEKLWDYGPRDFYEKSVWGVSWPNQPPGTMYLFGLIFKIEELLFNTISLINQQIPVFPSFIIPYLEIKLPYILVKLPFVLAEVGLGWLVYRIIISLKGDKNKALIGSSLVFFNPALIYNSAVWGQTDALINFLALLGIWLIWKEKHLWGLLSFMASLFFKLSLVVWLPVLGLILLRNKNYVKKSLSFCLSFLFFIIISLPFVHHGNVFTWLWYLYTNRVLARQGNMLSGNAFNLWTLIFGIDLSIKETISFLGTSARRFGRFVFGQLAVFISLYSFYKQIKFKRRFYFYLANIVLLSMAAFLFLTNMHERYLYPVFAPCAVLTATGYLPAGLFWLVTGIHFINLYNLWWYPSIPVLKGILEWRSFLVPRFLSLSLLIFFVYYLINFLKFEYQNKD